MWRFVFWNIFITVSNYGCGCAVQTSTVASLRRGNVRLALVVTFARFCLSICLSVYLIYLSICLSLSVCPPVRYVHPCCSHLEHRAFVKRFVSFQVLNFRQSVGLLGRTGQHKHIIIANIHALSEIRTHDPSVRAGEDILSLRPRGQCARPVYSFCLLLIIFLSLTNWNIL
jgi:hypothetical protein